MKISIITVGKIKERYFAEAIEQYVKQINKTIDLRVIEVPDEKAPEKMSEAEEITVKKKEGSAILKNISNKAHVITLEIQGKSMNSKELKNNMKMLFQKEKEEVVFVIGGSLGLSEEVIKRSNEALSFSKMTFPHQLMRVILLEQLSKIMN